MDEAIGGRPSITPRVLIASSCRDAAVSSAASTTGRRHKRGTRRKKDTEDRRPRAQGSLRRPKEKELTLLMIMFCL